MAVLGEGVVQLGCSNIYKVFWRSRDLELLHSHQDTNLLVLVQVHYLFSTPQFPCQIQMVHIATMNTMLCYDKK